MVVSKKGLSKEQMDLVREVLGLVSSLEFVEFTTGTVSSVVRFGKRDTSPRNLSLTSGFDLFQFEVSGSRGYLFTLFNRLHPLQESFEVSGGLAVNLGEGKKGVYPDASLRKAFARLHSEVLSMVCAYHKVNPLKSLTLSKVGIVSRDKVGNTTVWS